MFGETLTRIVNFFPLGWITSTHFKHAETSPREKKNKNKKRTPHPPGQPCIPNFFPSLWSQTSRNALSGSASSLVRS